MRYFPVFVFAFAMVSCSVHKDRSSFADNFVVAHRGAWKEMGLPENSIASLKHAIALKCAGSEFDVRMTKDDSLIVTHDPTYNGLVIEETEYAALAVHRLSNGETLPTLREYIKMGIENNSTTRLVCEIKPSKNKERSQRIAKKTVRMVEELNAQDMTIYISFDYGILQKIEQLNTKAHTQYLDGSKSPEQLKADGIDGADYYLDVFKKHPEWIASAKKNDITLNVWTVNDREDMDWFLDQGFDFITTNEPEVLLSKNKEKLGE